MPHGKNAHCGFSTNGRNGQEWALRLDVEVVSTFAFFLGRVPITKSCLVSTRAAAIGAAALKLAFFRRARPLLFSIVPRFSFISDQPAIVFTFWLFKQVGRPFVCSFGA